MALRPMMSSMGITSVEEYTAAVRELLVKGHKVKPNAGIEPALTALDFEGGIENMGKIGNGTFTQNNQAHYAAIETAFRNIFYELLVSPLNCRYIPKLRRPSRPQHLSKILCLVKYGIYLTSYRFSRI